MTFSIITITHNRAHLIGDTIRSVLNQTYSDYEHIIIDDGSNDDTENVVRSFGEKIRYFKYPKSGKRSFLRNECIRKSTGDLITILDSDDLWADDKLETIFGIFESHPDVDFVIHNLEFSGSTTNIHTTFPKYRHDFSGSILSDLLDNKLLPFPVFTIRRRAFEQIGLLDESMIDGQHDLYLRAASRLKTYYCSRKLTVMRKHDQNISAIADVRHYTDYIKAIEKLETAKSVSPSTARLLKSRIHSKMAYIYLSQKRRDLAKVNFEKSFRSHFSHYTGFQSAMNYLKLILIRSH